MIFFSQVFEGNVSMISLTSSLEDMKLRYDESICKESKNIAGKMEESYKESFSQVRPHEVKMISCNLIFILFQIKLAIRHKAQYLESLQL